MAKKAEGLGERGVLAALSDTHREMAEARTSLQKVIDETGGSRELSLALTNLEQAMMWLKEHGHKGRWIG